MGGEPTDWRIKMAVVGVNLYRVEKIFENFNSIQLFTDLCQEQNHGSGDFIVVSRMTTCSKDGRR